MVTPEKCSMWFTVLGDTLAEVMDAANFVLGEFGGPLAEYTYTLHVRQSPIDDSRRFYADVQAEFKWLVG